MWATVPDQNGVNPKRRPLVLLVSAADIPAEETLLVVAVSHTFPTALPDDHVLLPYSKDPRRRAVTGLKVRSAAVCSWITEITREEIEEVGGVVPPTKLVEIFEKISKAADDGEGS